MTIQDAVRAAMVSAHMTQREVAEAIGAAGQSKVSMALQSKNMRTDTAVSFLNACGFELIARGPHGEEYVIGDEVCPSTGETESADDTDALSVLVKKLVKEELDRRMKQ